MKHSYIAMLDKLPDMARVLARYRAELIERTLVTMVEAVEGRVPSNDEVRRYGQRLVHRDGKESYVWRGELLFNVEPENGFGWRITA